MDAFSVEIRLESVAFGYVAEVQPRFNGRIPRAFWNEIRQIVITSGFGHTGQCRNE
jgi:hypothetical protein